MSCYIRVIVLGLLLFTIQSHAQTTATTSAIDFNSYGVVLDHPGMKDVVVQKNITYTKIGDADQHIDIYFPPSLKPQEKRPVIIFLNAIGDHPGDTKVKDWAVYTTWPKLIAAHGYVGISMESKQGQIQECLTDLFNFIGKSEAAHNIDADRVGVYAASANVGSSVQYLMDKNAFKGIRAAVLYYGLSPEGPFRSDLPVYYVVSEADRQHTDYSKLWNEVLKNNAPWTIKMGSRMPHAFDIFTDNDDARKIIKETISFWKNHLDPIPKPSFPYSHGRQILSLMGIDKDRAFAMLKKLTDENPADIPAAHFYGHNLYREKRYDEAKALYGKLLKREPNDANAMINLAAVYYATGEVAQAEEYVKKAEATGKMKRGDYSQLGLALLIANRNDEAAGVYLKSIAIEPHVMDYYNLACAYAKNNHTEKALAALEKSIDLGYGPRSSIENDGDLTSLRNNQRFKDLLGRVK